MAGSLIGALKVSLGLDSAQFSAGLKKAQTNLSGFGKAAAIGFKAVAAGAAIAGAAMGVAVKHAIDHADALSKSAQKAGVTTEALSRLAYAADFSDVSLEQLTGGLQKLSKAVADAATNKTGAAAKAFQALGVSVTDANGKLRSSDAVFTDLSERFSRLQDGATKTALAMQIFGKSGAEMIPLLNAGAVELKRLADEADALGITLSTQTGRSAEKFNDTLTLIGKVLQGVANEIMKAALPALQGLVQTLASPEFRSAATGFAALLVKLMNGVIQVIVGAWNAAKDFFAWLSAKVPAAASGTADITSELKKQEALLSKLRQPGNGGGWWGADAGEDTIAAQTRRVAELRRQLAALSDPSQFNVNASFAALGGATTAPSVDSLRIKGEAFDEIVLGAKGAVIDLDGEIGKFTDSSKAMAAAVGDTLGSAFSRLAEAVMSGNDALSATVDVLGDLGKQLVTGSISNFFTSLFGGGLLGGAGLGAGAIGRGTYGGSGGFFPGFPGLAGGTDNWRGGMTWVGEEGPELLNLPRGSQVIPNHELGGMGADAISVSVVTEVRNGNLVPIMTQVAGQVAGRTVQQQAPAVVAKARRDKVVG